MVVEAVVVAGAGATMGRTRIRTDHIRVVLPQISTLEVVEGTAVGTAVTVDTAMAVVMAATVGAEVVEVTADMAATADMVETLHHQEDRLRMRTEAEDEMGMAHRRRRQ